MTAWEAIWKSLAFFSVCVVRVLQLRRDVHIRMLGVALLYWSFHFF